MIHTFWFYVTVSRVDRDVLFVSQSTKQNRQCMYKCNIETRSRSHSCHWKVISITYSECMFVALGIQTKMCMHHIVTWGGPAQLYNIFLHYLITGRNFRGKKPLNTICVFWVSLQCSSETLLNLRRIQWNIIISTNIFSQKVPIILVRF